MKGITTLCGSVRFKEAFEQVNRDLTLAGWIVLAPGVWEHNRLHAPLYAPQKRILDTLHLDKILMSDSIVVINESDYVGESTKRELEFAFSNGKIIYFLHLPTKHNPYPYSDPLSWSRMLATDQEFSV